MMRLTVPLRRFVDYVEVVKENHCDPYLDEVGWLIGTFQFDDQHAEYIDTGSLCVLKQPGEFVLLTSKPTY